MVWEGQQKGHDTTPRSQNAEQLRENGWLMLRSYVRASPPGAQAIGQTWFPPLLVCAVLNASC